MQEGVKGTGGGDRGWEVSAEVEDRGIEKNGYKEKGREVSSLGHVNCTLESPRGGGTGRGEAWMS